MVDIRKEFITELIDSVKMTEAITFNGRVPEGSNVGSHFSPEYRAGVIAGRHNAIQTLLSMTDSREGNDSKWRITDKHGGVVTFYPEDNPHGHPIRTDGGMEYAKGIIAEYFDMVSS